MPATEVYARGRQIAADVKAEFPELTAAERKAIVMERWKAVERDVARMRRRPR